MHRSGHRYAFSPPINFMTHYGKESKTSATEAAGDGSGQIHARAEIRRVPELLALAINGRLAKSSNTTVWLPLQKMNLWFLLIICDFCGSARTMWIARVCCCVAHNLQAGVSQLFTNLSQSDPSRLINFCIFVGFVWIFRIYAYLCKRKSKWNCK